MAPQFRADQIGSLLRPPELLEARSKVSSHAQIYEIHNDKQIREAEKKAIEWAVQKQRELSIRPICSGEYTRHIFYGGLFEKLEGMTPKADLPIPEAFRTDFPTTTRLAKAGQQTRAAVVCTGPIRWKESVYMEEWKTLRSSMTSDHWWECKLTLPAPTYQHIQLKPGTAYTEGSGYESDEEYFRDLAIAYGSEIKALYDEGLRNIQIDDPHLTYFCSSLFLEGCKKDGTDTDELLDTYLNAHNLLLEDLPKDLHVGLHLCRGNMSGSKFWVEGSYEAVAEKLFTKTNYETYYLEFDDTERQGGFEPLRFLPKGKNVILGLISTKRAEMEKVEDVNIAVGQAVNIIAEAQGIDQVEALDCLGLSPQCGFSSYSRAGGEGVTMDIMWEKLLFVRDNARRLWHDSASLEERITYT